MRNDRSVRRFILLMHQDTMTTEDADAWGTYLLRLRASGLFDGGSSIGQGTCLRREAEPSPANDQIVGYLLVRAEDLNAARSYLDGNPVYEAGGTVEIRELVED
jgi:hypothetical protein